MTHRAQSQRWSHDGRQIVLDGPWEGGGYAVYLMNADGSNVRRIAP